MKKLLICLAILFTLTFVFVGCGNTNEPSKDTTKETEKADTKTDKETTEKIEPMETLSADEIGIDTSEIEKGKGGDIVGTWYSDVIAEEVGETEKQAYRYFVSFIFKDDGTFKFRVSLVDADGWHEGKYTTDNGKITIDADNVNLTNCTYTVDGGILLFNSDQLNAAFRRQ